MGTGGEVSLEQLTLLFTVLEQLTLLFTVPEQLTLLLTMLEQLTLLNVLTALCQLEKARQTEWLIDYVCQYLLLQLI